MYVVINLASFLTSTRYIHEDAERLFLFQHKREPVQDFYFYILKKVLTSLNIGQCTPTNTVTSLTI